MSIWARVVIGLAAIGSAITFLLIDAHYHPEVSDTLCGDAGRWNCRAVIESPYSTLLGFPVATYGLVFYLAVFATMLVAAVAKSGYEEIAFVLLTPAVAAAVLVDSVLGTILVELRLLCSLCVLSYVVNLALLVTFVLWFRSSSGRNTFSSPRFIPQLRGQMLTPEQRVGALLYPLFITALTVAVFAVTDVIRLQAGPAPLSQAQIDALVGRFYARRVETIALRPSSLTIGPANAPVKIIAFTDFLCPPCRRIFAMDARLHREFGDALSIAYYNYPLDQACNPYLKETTHPGACVAAQAILAAADLHVLPEYRARLFAATDDPPDAFSRDDAVKLSAGLVEPSTFKAKMVDATTDSIIRRDIDLAEQLSVHATPTLFIDGRRIDGVPPFEVIEAIIRRELASEAPMQGGSSGSH
jgi:protein-disulfide isomerase/uncharacterized membrane protein